MKTVEYNYNNQRIEFFQKSDTPKYYMLKLKFTPFGGNLEPGHDDQVIKTSGQIGTFMHRILALMFATWLSLFHEDIAKFKMTDW